MARKERFVECTEFGAHLYHTVRNLMYLRYLNFPKSAKSWVYGSKTQKDTRNNGSFRVVLNDYELKDQDICKLKQYLLIKPDRILPPANPLGRFTLGDILPHGRDFYTNKSEHLLSIARTYCSSEITTLETYPGKVVGQNFTLVCTTLPMAKFAVAVGRSGHNYPVVRVFHLKRTDEYFLIIRNPVENQKYIPMGDIPSKYSFEGIETMACIEQQSVPLKPDSPFYKYFNAFEIVDKDKQPGKEDSEIVNYNYPQLLLTAEAEARHLVADIADIAEIDWTTARAMYMDECSAKVMVRVTECKLILNKLHLIQWLPHRCCYLVVWTPPYTRYSAATDRKKMGKFIETLNRKAGVWCDSLVVTDVAGQYDFDYSWRLSTYVKESVFWYRTVSIVETEGQYRLNTITVPKPYFQWNRDPPSWTRLLDYLERYRKIPTPATELTSDAEQWLAKAAGEPSPFLFFKTWLEVYKSVQHNPTMSYDKDCDSCAYCHSTLSLNSPFFAPLRLTLMKNEDPAIFTVKCTITTIVEDDFEFVERPTITQISFKLNEKKTASPVRATQEALLEWCTQCKWEVKAELKPNLKNVMVELIKRHAVVPILGPYQKLVKPDDTQTPLNLPENVLPILLPEESRVPRTMYYSVQ